MEKREFSSGGTVNEFRSINTDSQKLNTQANLGGAKPALKGTADPGGTRPPRAPEQSVPMPYRRG
jgi:hypothetical protein